MTLRPNAVVVIPDKLGGSLAIVRSLLCHRPAAAMASHLVLTHNTAGEETRERRAGPPRDASPPGRDTDTERVVEFALPPDNLHTVLRRLRAAIPAGPGVMVSNDLVELAMEHAYPTGRAVVQVLHGDDPYYFDLAARHQTVIDAFVAYSRAMEAGLRARLPHREGDIHHLPYGVPLPAAVRRTHDGPLRLVFAGRIEHEQKGVFDLPAIDRRLADRAVDVSWTVIGAGPDHSALRTRWGSPSITWLGALPHHEVLARLPMFDVFVLPTRAEGFPVALVEAMGAGLVPVVSRIASGVSEVVTDAVSGFCPPVGDVQAFADAVAALAFERSRLEAMSQAARLAVAGRFDPQARTAAYYDLFERLSAAPRTRRPSRVPYGSRLDRPWIPNALVRGLRTWRAVR
jgi:glycosyltransferase involved in cell wall biosynthesis